MTDWQKISDELAKDLDRSKVKPAQKFGPKGDYIEAWWAKAEANAIFGHDGWEMAVVATNCVMQAERKIGRDQKPGWGVTYTAHVRIRVGDSVTREDFGAGHGYDVDLGLAHESAIKEAVSDAMKRALKSFGWRFGLALYDKSKAHVGDYREELANEPEPKLPDHGPEANYQMALDTAQSKAALDAVAGQIKGDKALDDAAKKRLRIVYTTNLHRVEQMAKDFAA